MNHESAGAAAAEGPAARIVIVGAGPTGLALACELALAGIPCRVLERRARRAKESRAFILHARTMEMLALRGMADEAVARCHPVSRLRLSAKSSVVDFGCLDSRYPYLAVLSQSVIEDILESRARMLGVEIIREAEVVDLVQDATGVTLQIGGEAGDWEERAAYAVGCDGADSVLRRLVGIPLDGGTMKFAAVLADVRLRRPPAEEFTVHPGVDGAVVSVPYTDGWYRVMCLDRSRPWTDEPVTLEEVRASLHRVTGQDLDPFAPRWMARFRLHERLAARYRSGRVLLAGDAAHLHSPLGGQGLNIGIQEAFNLGWKLAAVLNGWAREGLLDSYEAERRPVARGVIRVTGRGTSVLTANSRFARFTRALTLSRMLLPVVQRYTREALSGIATRYPAAAGGGRLSGRRVGDVRLTLPDGRDSRLFELMGDGRFGLVDFGPDGVSAAAVGGWSNRVRPIVADLTDPAELHGAVAVLVRPDGYAAWSGSGGSPAARAAECRRALARWCGPEHDSGSRGPMGPGTDEVLGMIDAMDGMLFDPPGHDAVRFGAADRPPTGGATDAAP